MISLPLMRGEPSRRNVARVLCLLESNNRRARATSSGASASICRQPATARSLRGFRPRDVPVGPACTQVVDAPDARPEVRRNLFDRLTTREPVQRLFSPLVIESTGRIRCVRRDGSVDLCSAALTQEGTQPVHPFDGARAAYTGAVSSTPAFP